MNLKLLLLTLLFVWTGSALPAKDVEVKEVKLSLFNKSVTGYRMTIDRSTKVVSKEIIKHISKYNSKPFEFEKTVIYENIIYPPILQSTEISLYFLLHGLPGNYTELTVVAMYDYKNSINTEKNPELALKLLTDLSLLLGEISGDNLKFENMLIDENVLASLHAQQGAASEQQISDQMISHYAEEEVENNNVLIKTDPFNQDSVFQKQIQTSLLLRTMKKLDEMEMKQAELATMQEKLLLERQELEAEKKYQEKLLATNVSLRDSIVWLNKKNRKLMHLDLLGDNNSVSASDQEAFSVLEDKLKENQRNMNTLLEINDSLHTVMTEQGKLLAQLNINNRKIEMDLRDVRINNSQLKGSYLDLKAQMANQQMTSTAISENQGTPSSALLQNINQYKNQNRILLDSIARLNKQLEIGSGLVNIENATDEELLILQQLIEGLQNENKELKQSTQNLASVNNELEQSLKSSVTTMKNLESASNEMLSKMQSYQSQLGEFKGKFAQLEAECADSDRNLNEARDSLNKSEIQKNQFQNQLITVRQDKKALARESEALQSSLDKEIADRQKLSLQIANLQVQIDTLSKSNLPVSDQEAFVREQRVVLTEKETELNKLQTELSDKEKLMTQREALLAENQKVLAKNKARYTRLEAWENELKLLEQQLKSGGGKVQVEAMKEKLASAQKGSSVIVGEFSYSRSIELGRYVPVIVMETGQSIHDAKVIVAAYLLERGYLYEEQDQVFLYENVLLPQIDGAPMLLKFRFKEKGENTLIKVSYRLKSGKYIDPRYDNELRLKAESFMTNLAQ